VTGGAVTIPWSELFMVIGGAATIATSVFWGAYLLGKITNRIERVEVIAEDLDHRMDRAGQKMSDLADEVQKIGAKVLP
jgi:hypothetical protein